MQDHWQFCTYWFLLYSMYSIPSCLNKGNNPWNSVWHIRSRPFYFPVFSFKFYYHTLEAVFYHVSLQLKISLKYTTVTVYDISHFLVLSIRKCGKTQSNVFDKLYWFTKQHFHCELNPFPQSFSENQTQWDVRRLWTFDSGDYGLLWSVHPEDQTHVTTNLLLLHLLPFQSALKPAAAWRDMFCSVPTKRVVTIVVSLETNLNKTWSDGSH